MTKIKNTKKGMAKKTLSVSLAVAMLATSNVPVWAAEFSDGADAAFTSEAPVEVEAPVVEAEAPVVDEAEADVPVAQVAEDYSVDTNMELKSTAWNDNVKFVKKSGIKDNAKFEIKDKNLVTVPTSKISYEVYYNDDLQQFNAGQTKYAFSETRIDNDVMDITASSLKPGLAVYQKGGKVTVKFYVDGENEAVATYSTQIQAVDLSEAKIAYAENSAYVTNGNNVPYNGTIQSPNNYLTVSLNGESVDVKDYVVKFKDNKEAKNVGTYEFAIEGIEENGYTGSTKYENKFVIDSVEANEENLSVVLSGETTYNGVNTKPTVKVMDKLAKVEIPSELYTVKFATSEGVNVGEKTEKDIKVCLNTVAIIDSKNVTNNFVGTGKENEIDSSCITGEFKVNQLDLSKLGDKYDIKVAPQEVGSNATKTLTFGTDITLIDKATNKVVEDPTSVLPTGELKAVLTNATTAGKHTLTISAKEDVNVKNIINEYKKDIDVYDNVIGKEDVALPAGTKITSADKELSQRTLLSDESLDGKIQQVLDNSVYTGSALEPLKSVFESIVWKEASPSGKDVKFVLGKDYTLTYTNNTDSSWVTSKKTTGRATDKTATVTLKFIGDYAGTISYNFTIAQATAYVTGKDISYEPGKAAYDANVKVVTKSGTKETAIPEKEYTVKTTKEARKIDDLAIATVVFENPNYKIDNQGHGENGDGAKVVNPEDSKKCSYITDIKSTLVKKSLADSSVSATVDGVYTYTGKAINPKLVVKDGNTLLEEGTDYKVKSKTGTDAGDAYITIEGLGKYQGTVTIKYTIAKADMANATPISGKVDKDGKIDKNKETNYDVEYDGYAQKPYISSVKFGDALLDAYDPITKTGDYEITWDKEAVEVGTYNFTITAMASSKKVQGTYKGTFKVVPKKLEAHFAKKATPKDSLTGTTLPVNETGAYYTGKAITADSFKTKLVVADKAGEVLTEGKDYRLVYEDNVDAGVATIKAFGIGNHVYVSETTGKEEAIATVKFTIQSKGTIDTKWVQKVNDVEYAGGLPVEPDVVIVDEKGNRLVQGVDYTVTTSEVDVTKDTDKEEKAKDVVIKGKGAYTTTNAENANLTVNDKVWNVIKKDLKNTTISVDNANNVTVINGSVVVPAKEYDVAFSADGKKVTVTAKADSKNYTGSKEQDVDVATVGQAWVSDVQVVGNKATVVLSGDVDNASGYDYVIATEDDLKSGRVDIVKNQIKTTADFQYVQKGTYYAYCHAWKRVDGKKVFGEWSNVFQFTVGATTPAQPVITSVKRSGSTVTVTYTKAANADGYDVVLGTKTAVVSGEKRPVNYGRLVKKNVKGDTVTVTFKDVPAGTYYAGLHAWNRTSLDNKKVFSPWSNIKTVTVK